MNILKLLSDLKHNPRTSGVRRFTNLLYYDKNCLPMDLRNLDYVVVDGFGFYATEQINSLQRVFGNPWFEGARSDDVALDIGACIGAITIPLASRTKKVYAVEPLYDYELRHNLELNKLTNVQVIKRCIGPATNGEEEMLVSFAGRNARVSSLSFRSLRNLIGEQIDFLKMDGEGCEWHMRPEELAGIRELRIEFHIRRGRVKECRQKFEEYVSWMNNNGYFVHVDHPKYGPDPYDKEDFMVRATKMEA